MSRLLALTLALAAAVAGSAAAQAPQPVTFSGEVRARSEWDNPGGGQGVDIYTYLRTRLGVGAAAAPGVRLMFQLQDSRVYGATGASNITDLHQAYVDLGNEWRDLTFTARVGRQEISLGNERLVGPVGWSNTGRTFDGARLLVAPGSTAWNASLFVATVEERGRHFGGSTPGAPVVEDRAVAGFWFTRGVGNRTFEATALYDAGASYRSFASSNRYTLDGRLRSNAAAAFGFDVEAAWQGGTQKLTGSRPLAQDVSAWFLGARAGRFAAPGRRTAAHIGVDILSGDGAPLDGEYHAFNTMYATNHPFYGIADLFLDPAGRTKDAGLVDAFGSATRAVGARTTLRADLHRFTAQAGPAGEIGWELDLLAPVRLSPAATLEFGYTAFRASGAAKAMGLGASGDVRHWAYLQLRAGF